ncbi:cytochrome c oxidase assembly protein COX18, mitochondrial isoform X2 [Betta splendens]|uniref:Cytochrome c oxidase assembly protein COX18, mitochondrial isoform X2 n=1 Tax=Betta splendens TaxID=158456 RepID=A0A9W2Y2S4_BETSP|nr:cytochrome c oxidase assembly protein COX18, mitochondrial isoform X2 [Betta splendens]
MQCVGVLVRSRLLQLPLRGLSAALIYKSPSPGLTRSALESPAFLLAQSPVRTLSGGLGPDQSGWYSSLADSAPVHLCEHFLVESLQVEISELAKRLRYEVSVKARDRGWTERKGRFIFQKNLRRLMSQLYIRDNCHPFKASVLIWVQLPIWISLSMALRNLSMDHSALHGDLAGGGVLWFHDLTLPDSTWILPICVGLTNLFIVEVFSLQRLNPTYFQKLVLNMIRGFSILMVPIAATVPSSMVLYWFTSSVVGLSHNLLLRSARVHKVLQLRSQKSETPYRDLLSAFLNKYCK